MGFFDRPNLMKIHMLLAAFILPVAFMFLLTGGLYTWGIKGDYKTTGVELILDKPLEADKAALQDLVSKELQRRQIELPSGGAGLKKVGTSFQLEWTGSGLDVVLEPTANPLLAKMEIKKTDWHRRFVQLHKAKGGTGFKVYAAILAMSLFTLLCTGFLLAWQLPKYRKPTAIATVSGIGVFVAMIIAS